MRPLLCTVKMCVLWTMWQNNLSPLNNSSFTDWFQFKKKKNWTRSSVNKNYDFGMKKAWSWMLCWRGCRQDHPYSFKESIVKEMLEIHMQLDDISKALSKGNQSTINVHPVGWRSLASVHGQGDWWSQHWKMRS